MGINQPKVSALLRGNLSGFSLERLVRFLDNLDIEVDIAFQDKRPRRKPGRPGRNDWGVWHLLFLEVEIRINQGMEREDALKAIAEEAAKRNPSVDFMRKMSRKNYIEEKKKELEIKLGHSIDYYEPLKLSTLRTRYSEFINDPHNQQFIAAARRNKLCSQRDIDAFLIGETNRLTKKYFSDQSSPPNR